MRIAVALNSAVPDFGSVASIVSRFVGDVVLEVQGHERQPGPQRLVDADRHLDLTTPRDHAAPARHRPARTWPASSGEMSSDSPRRSGEV